MEPWELHAWHADFLDACNRHDLDDIRAFLAPDVRRAHLPRGADAWIDEFADLFRGFPDWQWKRIQLVAEEDRIAAHTRGSGTHTGVFRGVGPTRRHVNEAEFAFYRVTNRRITECSGTGPLDVLAAIGVD